MRRHARSFWLAVCTVSSVWSRYGPSGSSWSQFSAMTQTKFSRWPRRALRGHSCTPVTLLLSGWMAAHNTAVWTLCVNVVCLNISGQFGSRRMKHKTHFCVCVMMLQSALGVFYWKSDRPRPETCLWPTLVVTKDEWRYTETHTFLYQKWVPACI